MNLSAKCLRTTLLLLALLGACRSEEHKEDPHIKVGDLLLAQGKYDEAATEYQKAVGGQSDLLAQARLAGVYETQGDFVRAARALAAIAAKSKNDPRVVLSQARLTALTGRPRTAFESVRAFVEKAPNDPRALGLLAVLASTPDQLEIAIDRVGEWITVGSKAASSKVHVAAETLLPLSAAYDLRGDTENAARARAQAERIGVKDVDLAIELANTCFALQRLQPAAELLQAAGKAEPKRGATWLRLAAVEIGRRKYAQAMSALERIGADASAQPETALLRARVLLGLDKVDEAQRTLEALTKGDTGVAAQAHLWLGNIAKAKGDAQAAERAFLAALHINPKLASAELALADLYVSAGTPARAIERLSAFTAKPGAPAAAFRALGKAYLDARNPGQAQQAFARMAELVPEDPDALLLEASAWSAQQRWNEAKSKLTAALQLAPGSVAALRELVTVHVRQGAAAEAEARVRAEIARVGSNARLLALLGDVLFHQRSDDPSKIDAAEKAYREATSEAPDDASTWVALGNLYVATGRDDRAEQMYAEARKRRPEEPDAFLRAAQLALKRGAPAEAEQAYLEVIARHPTLVPALNNLAYLYLDALRAPEKAVELAERAHRAAPDLPSVADTYGWALLSAGKADAAIPVLERAAQALPDSAEVQFHLGMARLATGSRSEGQAALERALSLDPAFRGHEQARAALRRR